AAADTFRAAAIEQLGVWAKRLGAEMVSGQYGADPAALCYDAYQSASKNKIDFLLCDTAGRQHTKTNLMAELQKMKRTLSKLDPDAPHETLLVVDATTGSNALSQAREFQSAIGLSGLIVTKLDGSGKGGIVVAIQDELKIPTRFVGTGEKLDDFAPFDASEFIANMLQLTFKTVAEALKETLVPEDSVAPLATTGLRGFLAKFTVLKGAQRELWLTFLIKLLIISAYSITNKTLILWLSSDLGFNDQTAGALVGWIWAPAMTVFTLLAGSVTDAMGLRRTFFIGVSICLVALAGVVFTTIPWLALAGGLFPLVIGEALGTPVLIAATRRYSTTQQRSISFSIIYMVMNVGYLIAAQIFDYIRQSLGEHGHITLFGSEISAYRSLFLVSLGFELLLLPTIYFLRRGAEATDEGVK